MSKLLNELASKITLEQRMNFAMKQSIEFQSRVLGISVEETRVLSEQEKEKCISKVLNEIPAKDLFDLITPEMLKNFLKNQ